MDALALVACGLLWFVAVAATVTATVAVSVWLAWAFGFRLVGGRGQYFGSGSCARQLFEKSGSMSGARHPVGSIERLVNGSQSIQWRRQ